MKHSPAASSTLAGTAVFLAGLGIALASARPHAGSWNDGSRLATVECLIDHHTFVIDDSIFVRPSADASRPSPYPPDEPGLLRDGTLDKLRIAGHYYSDKSPVTAVLLAGWYAAWQAATGSAAAGRPDLFCYAITVFSSGLAYALALWCTYRLGRTLGLSAPLGLALTASLGLCTVALPYVRHVNSHILLLGISSAILLGLVRLGVECGRGQVNLWRVGGLGVLAGLGYAVDAGTGAVLLLSTSLVVLWRCPRPGPVICFAFGVAPWLVLHHALNYAIGGTFKPVNAVPAYFDWPRCPFDASNITGIWTHEGPVEFLVYTASLLFGKRGFLGHNLPLFLALPALVLLLRRRLPERAELVWAAGYAGGTWLLFGALSCNSSGACCSIRWFVPLLAPGYFALAVFLREYPRQRWAFFVLSAWGALLVALMGQGPWSQRMVPLFWPIQAAALLCCAVGYFRQRRGTAPYPAVASAAEEWPFWARRGRRIRPRGKRPPVHSGSATRQPAECDP